MAKDAQGEPEAKRSEAQVPEQLPTPEEPEEAQT